MKLLPVFLTHKTAVELPIVTYNCERIILSKLVCTSSDAGNISNCTIYFNGTPVKYTRRSNSKKTTFFVDGIPDNIKSFHLFAPCKVSFMIDFPSSGNDHLKSDLRFSLHLSLEINTALRNVG